MKFKVGDCVRVAAHVGACGGKIGKVTDVVHWPNPLYTVKFGFGQGPPWRLRGIDLTKINGLDRILEELP